MRCWPCLCLLLGLSSVVWAQQDSTPSAPPAPPASTSSSPSSDNRDASGLSRDTTFPGDRPGSSAPGNTEPTKTRVPNLTPPRSDRVQADDLGPGVGVSSSKDTQIDLSPPVDDAKAHPQSSGAVAEAEAAVLGSGGITEVHIWDPHKAAKSVEVGDFYFNRKNYRAAADRYREALLFKDNDAVATIKLAVSLEKLGIFDDARAEYESYLKILPHGPHSAEAQKAIDRLKAPTTQSKPPQ